jgi:hypothetical protein
MKKALLQALIDDTQGKFFSIRFNRKDGRERVINGKNSHKASFDPEISDKEKAKRKETEYVYIFNRNKGSWASVHPSRVKEFKCGSLHLTLE